MATAPSAVHQNTRCDTGASVRPPAAMVSMISEPESDEVMKKMMVKSMPKQDRRPASGRPYNRPDSGRPSNILNSTRAS